MKARSTVSIPVLLATSAALCGSGRPPAAVTLVPPEGQALCYAALSPSCSRALSSSVRKPFASPKSMRVRSR
jgi:hypothetical protein